MAGLPRRLKPADMSPDHSFTITLSNNRTEKQGLDFVRSQDPRFVLPDRTSRAIVMERLAVPVRYARTFDLLYLRRSEVVTGSVTIRSPDSIDLVEVKTTQKELPNFPSGFFFGATKNEFDLGELIGERYRFCLVSLHPASRKFVMLTLDELRARIRTQRIQYQINL